MCESSKTIWKYYFAASIEKIDKEIFEVDKIEKAIEVLIDKDTRYRECDDDLCDDEGCVLYKAFVKYIKSIE